MPYGSEISKTVWIQTINVYLLVIPDELLGLLELLLGLVRPPSPLLRLLATPLTLTQQQVQHLALHISSAQAKMPSAIVF
jgi:hypothetical protein